jgi:hypothetical protein
MTYRQAKDKILISILLWKLKKAQKAESKMIKKVLKLWQ